MKCVSMVAAVLAAAGAAQAAFVAYDGSVPLQTTNWATTVDLPQWDPALFPGQVLIGVTLELNGEVVGTLRIENLDATAQLIAANVNAVVMASGPGALTVTVLPLAAVLENFDAFDGTIDYMGPSGRTFDNLMASDSDSDSSMDPGVLALYTGNGLVTFNVNAIGGFGASGGANIDINSSAQAAADIRIIYEFVPAPGALALLGLGGLVATRRRR